MPEIANEENDDKPMDCWDTLFSGKSIMLMLGDIPVYISTTNISENIAITWTIIYTDPFSDTSI